MVPRAQRDELAVLSTFEKSFSEFQVSNPELRKRYLVTFCTHLAPFRNLKKVAGACKK